MATKKEKPGQHKLTVQVPKKWNLTAAALEKLQQALQPIVTETISKANGPGDVIVCVVRTPPSPPIRKK